MTMLERYERICETVKFRPKMHDMNLMHEHPVKTFVSASHVEGSARALRCWVAAGIGGWNWPLAKARRGSVTEEHVINAMNAATYI
ncbi:hypothetical protein [Paraburkholderia caledonica]|uniref:hypothetical protein n=1 Tax=Paraburkholderia caledonica TaxID=134536 RepID=UPI0038BB9215